MANKKEGSTKEYQLYLAGLLKGISAHMLTLGKDEGKLYAKGFEVLKATGVKNSIKQATRPENVVKNRYRNVPAYDHSRVKLMSPTKEKGTDYINANWIDGFKAPKKYIASQGPVPDSIADFWSMVWDYQVTLIVKVTREVENGVLKCHRYWPDPDQEPPQKKVIIQIFKSELEIEHISTVSSQCWITRKFFLRKGTEERILTQLSYEAWPDHGVPLTSREFLTFRQHVQTVNKAKTILGPIVVHCSAGVGRTGTYITVDKVLDAVDAGQKNDELNLDKVMQKQRHDRVFMVQTQSQYEFTYRAVADGIRQKLKEAGGYTLSRDMKEFLDDDAKEALAAQQEEDVEVERMLANTRAALKATPQKEYDDAVQDGKDLDITRDLTNLESRVNSLLLMKCEIDMTRVSSDQIHELVRQSNALTASKKEAAAAKKKAALEKELVETSMIAATEQKQHVKMIKTAAERKADKFMKKMTQ